MNAVYSVVTRINPFGMAFESFTDAIEYGRIRMKRGDENILIKSENYSANIDDIIQDEISKITIYTAWIGIETESCYLSDTIVTKTFTNRDEMHEWIDEMEKKFLGDCGVTQDEYHNGNGCENVSVHWGCSSQELKI